jgi:hypothetical protein
MEALEFTTSELPAIMHVQSLLLLHVGESVHDCACCRTTLELGLERLGSLFHTVRARLARSQSAVRVHAHIHGLQVTLPISHRC